MEIITGFTGAKHVRSEQDRDINIGTFGEESYVLQTGMKMAAEVSSNNEIKIRDGVIMHQGCAASIKKNTYDTVTIVNGSQGMKRIDLIVARYQRNQDDGKEFMRFVAIQGTPAESNPAVPSHITGDIQSGDAVADMPMYKIIIDGLNITEVQKVFSEAPNIAELNRKLPELVVASSPTISYTPDRNCNVLVTYESCGWGFGGTTWQIEIAGSASSGDSPTRTNNKRGVFDGTDGIYKDVSTSAYFTGLRAGVTYTFSKETYAGSGGKEANPFMKLLAV